MPEPGQAREAGAEAMLGEPTRSEIRRCTKRPFSARSANDHVAPASKAPKFSNLSTWERITVSSRHDPFGVGSASSSSKTGFQPFGGPNQRYGRFSAQCLRVSG